MYAAANVTSEHATTFWLVAREEVQRQTGRHAARSATLSPVTLARDGREVHTGVPPRTAKQLRILISWLEELDLSREFSDLVLLELAIEAGGIEISKIPEDAIATESYRAARDALEFDRCESDRL